VTRQDIPSTDTREPEACFLPVWEAVDLLAKGRASAQDLVNWCEAAYAASHQDINALILADFAAARAAANASDERRRRGTALGPLDGIPFSIKESFDVAGWPTTCGSPTQRGNIAANDSAVVERLRAAGALLLGKTNVPIGLRDWQSYNAIYGTTRNPRDPGRTPGGSSGGSAAAVCAGMSFFDVGSDIGSSLRNPAHYCGVFSHKSSHGLVPLRGHGIGHGYGEQEINVAGPLARSAHDLELLLRTLAGADGSEALAYRLELPPANKRALADFRVAVLPSHALCETDTEVSDEIESLGRWLEGQGAPVRWNACPDFDAAALWHTYVLMLRATTSIHMDDASFDTALAHAAGAAPEDHSYATLQYTGTGMRHRQWLQLQQARAAFAQSWQRFFGEVDVLLCPAAATTAFALDERGEPWQRTLQVNGRAQPLTNQLFWAGHSGLCGLPSTVAPIGPGRSGLPVGVQIVAGRFADLTSLRFAQLLEAAGFAFRPPPVQSPKVQRAPAR
jgi:amidase